MLAYLVVPVKGQASIQVLLDTMTVLNGVFLRSHPDTPALYESGVRYQRERDREEWRTVPVLLARRTGDCEDLACWRAAELRVAGIDARAVVYKAAPRLWHVVVKLPDGSTEDPSRELGMGRK